MPWKVRFHPAFEPEFLALPEQVQDELLAHAGLLEIFGPELGRPHVDTLNASRYPKMKELRIQSGERRMARRIRFRSQAGGYFACGGQ